MSTHYYRDEEREKVYTGWVGLDWESLVLDSGEAGRIKSLN